MGTLRVKAVTALAPWAQDVVVTGHDADEVGLLVFPSAAAKGLSAQELAGYIQTGLRKLKAEGSGSSQSAQRALVLNEPPSMDEGEITDKGYINQRAVLMRRATQVQLLHTKPRPEAVIVCG